MKKLLISLISLAIVATACEEIAPFGIIVDWTPVEITIEAYDAAGNSIISPEMPGMTLTFKGTTYEVQDPASLHDEYHTKAYLAILSGLQARPLQGDQGVIEKYILWFGEIDGAVDMDEDIVLNWPDGSSDTIHYHCGNHREWPSPKCDRTWKLNGKKQPSSNFIFNGKSLPED